MGNIEVNVLRLRRVRGRYFWRPTKAVKKLGFANTPLGDDLVTATQEAQRLNAGVEKIRRGANDRPEPVRGSIAHVIKLYKADDAFTRLKPRTSQRVRKNPPRDRARRWQGDGRGDHAVDAMLESIFAFMLLLL